MLFSKNNFQIIELKKINNSCCLKKEKKKKAKSYGMYTHFLSWFSIFSFSLNNFLSYIYIYISKYTYIYIYILRNRKSFYLCERFCSYKFIFMGIPLTIIYVNLSFIIGRIYINAVLLSAKDLSLNLINQKVNLNGTQWYNVNLKELKKIDVLYF